MGNIVVFISGKAQSGKSSLAKYLTGFVDFYDLMCQRRVSQFEEHEKQIVNNDILLNQYDKDPCGLYYKNELTGKYWDLFSNDSILDKQKIIKKFSFAKGAKDFCIDYLGLKKEQCYGSDDMKNTLTPYKWEKFPESIRGSKSGFMSARDVMKVFATEICRDMFDNEIWVKATIKDILASNYNISFIDDMRFLSELDLALQLKNAYFVRLNRAKTESSHRSETELDNFDWGSLGNRVCIIDNSEKSIMNKNIEVCKFFSNILDENFGNNIKGKIHESFR